MVFFFSFYFHDFVDFCNHVLLLINFCFHYKQSSLFLFSSFRWTVFVVLNLFESHTLFLRSSPFLMSFRSLFAIAELIHRFLHNLETTIVKTYSWKNVWSGNVVRRNVQSGKSPQGKCPVGQVSVEEPSFGEVPAWDLSKRKCQQGNCHDTNYE